MLKDEEGGQVVLEFSYCFAICMVVVMLLFSFGFYAYQKVMLGIVTNQTAENVAATYKYLDLTDNEDMDTVDYFTDVSAYRYIFKKGKYLDTNGTKANDFLDTRLTNGVNFVTSAEDATATVEMIADGYGRYHYKVIVSQKYEFFWSGLLERMGVDTNQAITYTSYSEGVDMLAYANCIKDWKYGLDKFLDDSVIGKAISFWHSCFDD